MEVGYYNNNELRNFVIYITKDELQQSENSSLTCYLHNKGQNQIDILASFSIGTTKYSETDIKQIPIINLPLKKTKSFNFILRDSLVSKLKDEGKFCCENPINRTIIYLFD